MLSFLWGNHPVDLSGVQLNDSFFTNLSILYNLPSAFSHPGKSLRAAEKNRHGVGLGWSDTWGHTDGTVHDMVSAERTGKFSGRFYWIPCV